MNDNNLNENDLRFMLAVRITAEVKDYQDKYGILPWEVVRQEELKNAH